MIREILGLSDMTPIFDIKDDMVAILFSKQGQNYSQESFPRYIHLVQI